MNNNNTNHLTAPATAPSNDEIELMGPVALHLALAAASANLEALYDEAAGWDQGADYLDWCRVEAAVMACLHGRNPNA